MRRRLHETEPSPLRTNRRLFSQAPRHGALWEFGRAQRHSLDRGKRGQVASSPAAARALAHGLHADAGLGAVRRARARLCRLAAGANHRAEDRGGLAGQHFGQGASRRYGRSKKTVRKPSGARGEDSRPRFIWWPVMSGRPSASRSRLDSAPMGRRVASSSKAGPAKSPPGSEP